MVCETWKKMRIWFIQNCKKEGKSFSDLSENEKIFFELNEKEWNNN